MSARALAVLLALWLPTAAGGAGGADKVGEATRLVEFELADQFDRIYRSADYRGRWLVLLGSDRGGSKFNPKWGSAIEKALEEELRSRRVAVLYLADLGGVPGLLKKFIKGKFPDDERYRILLDWEGVFSSTYGFERKSANIFVFTPTGELRLRRSGREPEPAVVEEIVTTVVPPEDDSSP